MIDRADATNGMVTAFGKSGAAHFLQSKDQGVTGFSMNEDFVKSVFAGVDESEEQ